MALPLKKEVQEFDQAIRAGYSDAVRRDLAEMDLSAIPRERAAEMAKIARRVDESDLAIQILHPIVRAKESTGIRASGLEIAEYAAALTFVGSSQEAYGLLGKVNPNAVPEVLLYRAFALFSQWNYLAAIEPLTQYIVRKDISDYDRLVGKVNLASALVYERIHEEAETVLGEVVEETSRNGLNLLLGNALQLSAESKFHQGFMARAETLLYEAEAALKNPSGWHALFIRKWRCYIRIRANGVSEDLLKELHKIRSEASGLRHWETIRDCDRFEAVATKDKRLLHHVYFGSPFASFREHLLADFHDAIELPDTYFWGSRQSASLENSPEIDVEAGTARVVDESGVLVEAKKKITPNGFVHQALRSLSSDFYRPFRFRTLYAYIYPKELYEPGVSDSRVLHAVERLGMWFISVGLPVQIVEEFSDYRLTFTGPVSVKVARREPSQKS